MDPSESLLANLRQNPQLSNDYEDDDDSLSFPPISGDPWAGLTGLMQAGQPSSQPAVNGNLNVERAALKQLAGTLIRRHGLPERVAGVLDDFIAVRMTLLKCTCKLTKIMGHAVGKFSSRADDDFILCSYEPAREPAK
jgi:hypothetical protein